MVGLVVVGAVVGVTVGSVVVGAVVGVKVGEREGAKVGVWEGASEGDLEGDAEAIDDGAKVGGRVATVELPFSTMTVELPFSTMGLQVISFMHGGNGKQDSPSLKYLHGFSPLPGLGNSTDGVLHIRPFATLSIPMHELAHWHHPAVGQLETTFMRGRL